MDINIRIIEAVKEYPNLYKFNKFHSASRKQTWKLVAEKLNIQEQFLKIRWHSLVQRYQNDSNFKYSKQMNFLRENGIRSKQTYAAHQTVTEARVDSSRVNVENCPEFIITEKDLIPTGGHYDYVFVDVEELDNVTKNIENTKLIRKDDPLTMYHRAKKRNLVITQPSTKLSHLTSEQMIITKQTNALQTKQTEDLVRMADNRLDTNLLDKTQGQLQRFGLTSDKCVVSNKNSNLVTVSLATSSWNHTVAERSEDVIFGELITAMLKKMDDDKRKMVKKEIINLLLT